MAVNRDAYDKRASRLRGGDSAMKQKHRLKRIFSLGPVACLAFALVGNAQSSPAGQGSAEFQRTCSSCHSIDLATSQRMTRSQWAGVVSDMANRGAQGTSQEFDDIVTYLSTNFGPGKPLVPAGAPAAGHTSATPVAQKTESSLSEAEVSKAKELIQANGCSSCHRFGGMGSYVGPYLGNIGAHRSSEQLRASLVSPNKEVLPENRTVRLVTHDGKTVTGRILNQDGSSVQLIESSGQLRSFQKSSLREFTIVTTNSMPSYADKLSGRDLTDLVNYLSSLKGNGAQ